MQKEMIWKDARSTVQAVYTEVRAEAYTFLVIFENNAITITKDILKASEARAGSRIRTERVAGAVKRVGYWIGESGE